MSICECGHANRVHNDDKYECRECDCLGVTSRIAPDLAGAPETHRVTGCGDCPFMRETDLGDQFCTAARERDGYRDLPYSSASDPPPTWCPLRRGPTLVVLDLPKT